MSDPGAKGPSLVNRVLLNITDTQARTVVWSYECLAESDTESFLKYLLSYITGIFDNLAALFRVLLVDAHPDIEASYVPGLQSSVDWQLNIARTYAQQRLSGSELKAYLCKVETRLAARIQHWKAEALHQIAALESADAQSFGPDSESRAAFKTEPVPPEQMKAFETTDGRGAHSTGTMTKQMIVPRVKVGRRPKDQTHQIADLWEKMGCPEITAVVCDKIGKEFFEDELKECQPGSPEHKRVRERVRKAIERSGANAQHN
jgi:hypothetical protein